jgi:hypothetical protein
MSFDQNRPIQRFLSKKWDLPKMPQFFFGFFVISFDPVNRFLKKQKPLYAKFQGLSDGVQIVCDF